MNATFSHASVKAQTVQTTDPTQYTEIIKYLYTFKCYAQSKFLWYADIAVRLTCKQRNM